MQKAILETLANSKPGSFIWNRDEISKHVVGTLYQTTDDQGKKLLNAVFKEITGKTLGELLVGE